MEKTLMLGGIGGQEEKGIQRMRWLGTYITLPHPPAVHLYRTTLHHVTSLHCHAHALGETL